MKIILRIMKFSADAESEMKFAIYAAAHIIFAKQYFISATYFTCPQGKLH